MTNCLVLRFVAFSALVLCTAPVVAQMHWAPRATSGLPLPRSAHGMTYDSARQRLVVFGGLAVVTANSELWEWNGTAWQQRLGSGPSPRSNSPLAYDAGRGRVVLHGGIQYSVGGTVFHGDTWEWDGQSWTQQSQAGPQGIAFHAMAYDPLRGVTVLFGGSSQPGGVVNQAVWEWDGTVWRNLGNRGGPAGRVNATLTFVPTLGESLLVGGDANPGLAGEVWSWNGTRWLYRGMGPAVTRHGACWNPGRNRLVVGGGMGPLGFNDWTWEWDGVQWFSQARSTSYLNPALAYDEARGEVLQFGGLIPGAAATNAFLEFEPTVLPSVQAAGGGCGTPVLSAPVDPIVGQTTFGLRVQQAAGYRVVLMALSTQSGVGQTIGVCTVVPDLRDPPFVAGATDPAGTCWYPFPLPASAALRGLQFYAQAAVLDGSGPLLGIGSLSNALQVRIGD